MDNRPGITFSVNSSSLAMLSDGKVTGKVMLSAVADDIDIWKEVVQKLNGLRIHTVKDLNETALEIMQKKLTEAQAEFDGERRRHHQELEAEKAKNSFLAAENANLKTQLFGPGQQ